MTQTEKALRFSALHVAGNPLVLCNIWDAGSAKTVVDAGAPAIATGSWAVARAQGYTDGEDVPLDTVISTLRRITAVVDLPVTLDFETGYAPDKAGLADNISRVLEAGAIGINLEDQVIGGAGLRPVVDQTARITAIRKRAEAEGIALFINARTDVFFKDTKPEDHASLLPEAISRATAYADAGADGVFVPGLKDTKLIGELCAAISMPVNVMKIGDEVSFDAFSECGVSRISQGPAPYLAAMKTLGGWAKT